jgi:hypothetical protein
MAQAGERGITTFQERNSMPARLWSEIEPKDAVDYWLPHDDIIGPLTQEGLPCPWPWEPQQLVGAPLGQYHCRWCGEMVVAGVPHPDFRKEPSE